jgi:DNA-binding MarR family transcriptional regulator
MPSSLLLLLKQAERRIELGLQPLLDEFGLSIEQWRVMLALHEELGQPMSVLAEAAVLPAASLTRHVDKLVERGLVLRRIHPGDKRRIVTALSPVGTTVADRIAATQHDLEADLADYFQMEIHERSGSATQR